MARVEREKHVKYEKKTLRLLNNMPKVMIQNEYEREACQLTTWMAHRMHTKKYN